MLRAPSQSGYTLTLIRLYFSQFLPPTSKLAREVPLPNPQLASASTKVGAVSLRLYFPEILLSEV